MLLDGNITHIFSNTSPLCYMPDGRLLCYHRGKLVLVRDKKVERTIPMPIRGREVLLGWSKFTSRLLRFGVRAAEAIDGKSVVLSIGNMLYEVDVETGRMSKGWNCGEGIRPLIFTTIKGIGGFDDGICFGGYLGNRSKKAVNIYGRISEDFWQVLYTFPEGVINHVHNIVVDPYRDCLWIFTGDFDEAAAIWRVTDNFKKVECVVCNNQKYRACVAFALPQGLLYATDAPFAENYIYSLNVDSMEEKKLFSIDGSCIYGCQWKDKYVFSSTVEGDGRNNTIWQFYFSRKRGSGIKDDYVHMYMGNLQDGFHEIYKEKKDCLPLYSFQFGVFRFPYGVNNSSVLFFQPIATRDNDLDLMRITL